MIALCLTAEVMPDQSRSAAYLPQTVDERVENLISQLSLKDKAQISRMEEGEADLSELSTSMVIVRSLWLTHRR